MNTQNLFAFNLTIEVKKLLYIILLLLFFNPSFAQKDTDTKDKTYSINDLEKVIPLKSGWKFHVGNDSVWKDFSFDDQSWKEQKTTFQKIKHTNSYDGEAWFRYRFEVDSTLVNIPLALQIYSKADAKVYLNGKYMGLFGKPDKIIGDKEKNNPVIFAFDKPGPQLLAVHYNDTLYTGEQKIFETNGFDVHFLSVKQFTEKSQTNHYLWTVINIVGVVFITLGVIHLILFGFYRRSISNLFFSIFNICSGLGLLLIYGKALANGIEGMKYADLMHPYYSVISLIGSLAISATVNFLFSKNKIRFYALVALVSIAFLLTCFISERFVFLYSLISFMIMGEAVIVVIIAASHKKPGAKTIALGLLGMFISAVILGFLTGVYAGMGRHNVFVFGGMVVSGILMFFSTPFAMSAYLASNFAAVSRQLKNQLKQVNELSEEALKKEREKQELLEKKKQFLEAEVRERTKEIEEQKRQIEQQQQALLSEKQKSEDLLLNILPKEIAEELKESGESKIKLFDSVSILFTDFINLNEISEQLSAQQLLDELNYCFEAFDQITTKFKIEKIKTVGYSYMAVSGLPLRNKNHAQKMIETAFEIRAFIEKYQQERKTTNKPYFKIKFGINSGEVVAGIVGIRKFAYDIWGDAVNTAARIKGISENGKINISQSTYELAKEFYDFEYRGILEIKGKGKAKMYFVEPKNT